MQVMVVAAHPDDIERHCGGTVARWTRDGCSVVFVLCTSGNRGSDDPEITPDGMRGRVMSAPTWHTQGVMGGFNAVNGLLMDVPWMTVSLLFGGTGMLFAVLMLSSVLTAHLRTLYGRGLPSDVLVGVREEWGDARIERSS